jgi:hypothetical protein
LEKGRLGLEEVVNEGGEIGRVAEEVFEFGD